MHILNEDIGILGGHGLSYKEVCQLGGMEDM